MRKFFKNECLVFSWWKLYLPYLIFKGVEGWGEKEICTKGVSDGQKEGEGRKWGKKKERGWNYFSPSFVTFKNFGIYPWQPSCFGLCRLCGSWCFPHDMRTKRIQGRTHNSLYWHKPTTKLVVEMDECESHYIQSGKQRCSGKGKEFPDRAKSFVLVITLLDGTN